jgi:APA family basic amino acid/polyamine antiporter
LVIYFVCRRIYREDKAEDVDAFVMAIEKPSPGEKAKMDREFKIWRNVVIIALILVAIIYLIPFVI